MFITKGFLMESTKKERFLHNGKEYQIVITDCGNQIRMYVTLDNIQVSPTYGVDINVKIQYFLHRKTNLISDLVDFLKSEISLGIYQS